MVSNLEQKIDEDRTHRTLVSGCEGASIAVLCSVVSFRFVARETQGHLIYYLYLLN